MSGQVPPATSNPAHSRFPVAVQLCHARLGGKVDSEATAELKACHNTLPGRWHLLYVVGRKVVGKGDCQGGRQEAIVRSESSGGSWKEDWRIIRKEHVVKKELPRRGRQKGVKR